MKGRNCLNVSIANLVLLLSNPPIGESFAFDTFQRSNGAFRIRGLAMREAEVKLGAILLKMLLAHMVVRPDKAALEQPEERLHRIRMRDYAFHLAALARIFALRVIHAVMGQKVFSKVFVVIRTVGHKVRVPSDLRFQNRLEGSTVNVGNVERTGGAVTFHQRENLVLMISAAAATRTATAWHAAFDVAPKGFVGLKHFAAAAEDAAVRLHRLAQAVAHEPGGLVGHAKHAVELVAAHAFLAGSEQRSGHEPLVEGYLAAFKHGAYRNGELIAAVAAVIHAGAVRLAVQLAHAIC